MLHRYHTSNCTSSAVHRVTLVIAMLSLTALVLTSCKKVDPVAGTSSFTIVNAVMGSNTLVTNFRSDGPVIYSGSRKVLYKKFNLFSAYSGMQRVRLFEYPDTTLKDDPVFDLDIELPVGSVNTLFLTGTLNAPDTLLTRDAMPFFPSNDSAMGMRFVNLSPGSQPVSVNIKGETNGSVTTDLLFKGITSFRKYAINTNLPEYVFEFRDALSGDLIASYTTTGSNFSGNVTGQPNAWRYRSFTLALAGVPGGTGNEAQTIFLVNHY